MSFSTNFLFAIISLVAFAILFSIFYRKNKIKKKNKLFEDLNPDEIQDALLEIEELKFQKNCENELTIYMELNNLDFSTAYYELGKKYFTNNNSIGSNKKSFYFFQKASEYENIDAKYKLGLMFYEGLGTDVNYKKSFQFFLETSELSYNQSYYYLAIMYHKGYGTYQNSRKALECAQRYKFTNNPFILEILNSQKRNITRNYSYEKIIHSKQKSQNPKITVPQLHKINSLDTQDEFLSKWIEIEKLLKNKNKNKNTVSEQIDVLFHQGSISKDLKNELHEIRKRRNEFIHNKNEVEKISDKDILIVKNTLNQLKISINI